MLRILETLRGVDILSVGNDPKQLENAAFLNT
jgi:hypothetical protein